MKFSMAGFMLRSLIHFDLSYIHWDRYGSICILLHVDIQLWQNHLLQMLSFFPLFNFVFFVKNQIFLVVWINIWVFNLISLVHQSVFMPTQNYFYHCNSMIDFDVRDGDDSRHFFIAQTNLIFFHMKLSIVLLIFWRIMLGYLWGLH